MKLAKIDSTTPTELFPVSCGAIRVTDPCYEAEDVWCAGTLVDVMNGLWAAHVGFHKDPTDMSSLLQWKQKCEEAAKGPNEMLTRYNLERAKEIQDRIDAYTGRVAYLHIVHSNAQSHFDHEAEFDSTWEDSGIDVGVDSGQAGFFDKALFAQVCKAQAVKDVFYKDVCNITGDRDFGVCGLGAVSSTGYGDGGYTCLIRRVNGLVVEAIILFVCEYEEEEYDEEEEETDE